MHCKSRQDQQPAAMLQLSLPMTAECKTAGSLRQLLLLCQQLVVHQPPACKQQQQQEEEEEDQEQQKLRSYLHRHHQQQRLQQLSSHAHQMRSHSRQPCNQWLQQR
jgi:hypothetical protein